MFFLSNLSGFWFSCRENYKKSFSPEYAFIYEFIDYKSMSEITVINNSSQLL